MQTKGTKKVCSRDHVYYKSSDCPVCPQCWSGYYKQKALSDLPSALSAPALRALLQARIMNLKTLAQYSEKEVSAFHGMGPKGIRLLKSALSKQGLSFTKHNSP